MTTRKAMVAHLKTNSMRDSNRAIASCNENSYALVLTARLTQIQRRRRCCRSQYVVVDKVTRDAPIHTIFRLTVGSYIANFMST